MKNVSVSKKVTRLLVTIIIVAVTLVMVIPFVWMLSASFKTEADVMKIPIEWIPKYFYIDNYKKVLSIGTTSSTNYHFPLAYFNSIKVAVISTVVAITSATLAGYAFAKLKFKGSNVLFIIYLAQMMVPSQLTLIPQIRDLFPAGLDEHPHVSDRSEDHCSILYIYAATVLPRNTG